MSDTRTNIGKLVFISTTLPATNNAAGFEALTWTEVEGVVAAPQLGVTHNMIDIPTLKTGYTRGVKGARTGVNASLSIRIIDGDSSQATLRSTADDDQGAIAIKIGTPAVGASALAAGDTVQYAQGVLHSYQENPIDTSSYEGFTTSFRQNEPTVNSTEPA